MAATLARLAAGSRHGMLLGVQRTVRNGDVKRIMKVFAENAGSAPRDPAKGNARVTNGTVTQIIFAMAGGKATTVLDGAAAALSESIPENSLQNVLLMIDPADKTNFGRIRHCPRKRSAIPISHGLPRSERRSSATSGPDFRQNS